MRKTILFVIFALVSSALSAQRVADTWLWTGAELKVRLSDKLQGHVEEQVRFNDTISSFASALTELGLRYRLGRHFTLGPNFRYITRPNADDRFRYMVDLQYKWKRKGFPLSVRNRLHFQHTVDANSAKVSTYLREKISVKYHLSRVVRPVVEYETSFRFNDKNEFRRNRVTVGMEWRLTDRLDLTTYYRFQDEINVRVPERDHIFAVLFAYTLDLRKRGKEAAPDNS